MLTLDYAVVTDAPTTLASEGDVATSRVQIAKTGKFSDPRYGKFKITLDDFKTWIKNFNAIDRADGRAGIAVDVDHNPEKGVSTEAAGWVVALDTVGNELWATVEWNTLGKELVADKRYLYLSPSYQHNYVDEFGKKYGTKLMGVALTNRPFLTMATVTLSASATFASFEGDVEEATPPVPDSPPAMPELSTTILSKLGLGADADEAAVLAAVDSLSKPAAPDTINLSEIAASQGMVILKADAATQLAADAAAGREAAKTLHQQRFDTAFTKALSEGRTVPALKESMQSLYEANADATISMLEASPVMVSTKAKGSPGDDGAADLTLLEREAEGHPMDDDRVDLHAKAESIMREQGVNSYSEAVLIAAQGA